MGERIPAATVVWCAGMNANPLTRLFQVERDRLGHIPVDEFMKVRGVSNAFAAGHDAEGSTTQRGQPFIYDFFLD
jgi:NADH:ubiquinone reductase (H+-translocating)